MSTNKKVIKEFLPKVHRDIPNTGRHYRYQSMNPVWRITVRLDKYKVHLHITKVFFKKSSNWFNQIKFPKYPLFPSLYQYSTKVKNSGPAEFNHISVTRISYNQTRNLLTNQNLPFIISFKHGCVREILHFMS